LKKQNVFIGGFFMKRKSKISYEIKLKAVKECISNKKLRSKWCCELDICMNTIKRWIVAYKNSGAKGLKPVVILKRYSKKLKIKAVKEYLNGKGSYDAISLKYGIKSSSLLRQWVILYNSHKELNSSFIGGNNLMTKLRKTTLEERIEIVHFCIENGKKYAKTSEKYNISYQQVRTWTLKYESLGIAGLEDRRGKSKKENNLSEIEKLKLENKLLQMENDLLKKLKEIERR